MIRAKTWFLGLTAIFVAGAAWAAPINGVGEGSGPTRLDACRETLKDAARDSEVAAMLVRVPVDSNGARSMLITAEVSACDCEENPSATSAASRWRCLAPWRLVAMPEQR